MKVLGIYHRMEGLIATTLDLADRYQPRIDGIAELGDYDQVVYGPTGSFGAIFWVVSPNEVGLATVFILNNSVNVPDSAVDTLRILTAIGQKPDLVASPHGPIGKFDRFGNVAFKVEPEGTAARQRLDLSFQVGAKLRIEGVYPAKQTAQPRHEYPRLF